jgi:dienelactone hydrolase
MRPLFLFAALLLTACAQAPHRQTNAAPISKPGSAWQMIPHTQAGLADPKELRAYVSLQPVTAGKKAPAIVLLHGCGGVGGRDNEGSARHKAAIEKWHKAGYSVLFLDSFTSRGLKEVCTSTYGQRNINPIGRARDARAALDFLAEQAEVDEKRVALLGWSHGGSTTLRTLDTASKPARDFAAAVAFYPGCTAFNQMAHSYPLQIPLMILIGEADDWTPAAPCAAFAETLKNRRKDITYVSYPDAYHGFDGPGKVSVRTDVPNGVNKGKGVTTGHNPAAFADSQIRVPEFLKKHL